MTARTFSAVLTVGICLLATAPSAFAAAPAFKLTASSQPTNFAAGEAPGEKNNTSEYLRRRTPQYSLIATNIGSVATSGPVTFIHTLPDGLTPTAALARDINQAFPNGDIPCVITGQTVTCTEFAPLRPGDWAQFLIPVKVAEDVPPSLTSQARILGGDAGEATTTITTTISTSLPSFDFLPGAAGLSAAVTGPDGQPATQAGSHPYEVTVDAGFPSALLDGPEKSTSSLYSSGHVRDLKVRLPRGMIANPTATPLLCREVQLESKEGCPDTSSVGTVTVTTNLTFVHPYTSPLFNMVPPPAAAAELAFNAVGNGIFVHLMGKVSSSGEYELGIDASEILARELNPVFGTQAQLWGNPSDPSHDTMRGNCAFVGGTCPLAERANVPFLTMPSSCRSSLDLTAGADSWEETSRKVSDGVEFEDSLGNPTGTDGCNKLDFDPQIEAKPTTNLADAPSGLEFNLHVPQTEKFEELATANFRGVKVTLPKGMSVNPSSANGQGACGSAQIGLTTPIGRSQAHFTEDPGSCPPDSKIGAVEVNTPLLDHPLDGAVYLAQPFDNPFGSLIAIYLDIEDPVTGVVSKLAGRVDLNPQTGQLTTTFSENPELPIEDVKLSLFKGPRAPLRTPNACGAYSTTADITPWSSPEGLDAHLSDPFATSVAAAGGGACPSSEAAATNHPAFRAGMIVPQAGAYSPFVLKLSREDGSQPLASIDATLPKGLIGRLAGTAYCSEAQIAQAEARDKPNEGILEKQSPSCPASSEVGSVDVAAGAGITPFHATGHAYLAGPYKGAPVSLVVITPAIAGPFDLGAVVVRNALKVDPVTAQVRAVSDPFPQILEGIPLDLRSIEVKLNRPDFTLNPTSCDPMSIIGSATSALGSIAPLTSPFQVGGCQALKFAPKLATRLIGPTTRGGHPALKATFTAKPGEAATARLSFALPHSEFIDQGHFRTICTRVQFAASQCPAGSVYGQVKATTPLLDYPLEGPIYLRSSNNKLPDVVLALRGPPSQPLEVDLAGKVDSLNGGIRTTFESLPDAPLTKATVSLQGGKKGLFQNSTNICRATNRATLQLDGQNGKTYDTRPAITVASCKGKSRKKAPKGHKGKAHR